VRTRGILQSLLKLIVLHLMVLAVFTLPAVAGQYIIGALSPHMAIVGAVAVRSVGLLALAALPMLVIVTLRRRWFCRYLCPVGLIVDSCAKVRPGAKYAYRKIPPIGQWLMLATLGGAIIGWPLFLWLDPLSIFGASLNASHTLVDFRWQTFPWQPVVPYLVVVFHGAPDAVAIASLSAIGAIVMTSLIFPKLWCIKLCPLGGMQELLFAGKLLATRKKEDIPKSLSPLAIARRSAIFAGLGVAGGLVVSRFDRKRNKPKLRPPGSVDDTKFKGLCARCGNCVKACPTGIISQDVDLSDPAGLLAPSVSFKKGVDKEEDVGKYCLEDCHSCGQACPTGAIASLSLKDKLCRPIGLADVNMEKCLLTEGIMCNVCTFEICPQNAVMCNELTAFETEIVIDADKCNGCGACVLECPRKVIKVDPNGRYVIAPLDDGAV
jgi:ferredoxin